MTAQVKPPLSITSRYPRVKLKLKSPLCFSLDKDIKAEALAGLCSHIPFPQDCVVPAPRITVTITKGGALRVTPVPAGTAITPPLLCGTEQLLKSDASRSQSGFTESHSRKYHFYSFSCLYKLYGIPPTLPLPFLGLLVLCSPDTELFACQRKQAIPVIKGSEKIH